MLLRRTFIFRVGLATLSATICLAQTRMPEVGQVQAARTQLDHVTNWPTPLYWQPTTTESQSGARAMRTEAATPASVGSTSATASPALFVAVTPCRLVDTRIGQGFSGAFGPPSLPANTARTIPVPTSSCGLPVATAYSLNFTVVPPAGASVGYVKAWPDDESQPNTAVLTDTIAGAIVGNAAIVPAGADGGIEVLSQSTTDLVIDINGYFLPPGSLPLAGTAAAPALTFGDTTTGLYSTGAGTVSIATGGVNRLTVRPDGDLDLSGNIRKGGVLFLQTSDSDGGCSTALGIGALAPVSGATYGCNSAVGSYALASNTTGSGNAAVGASALATNTSGGGNTALGYQALNYNTTGKGNTAVGNNTLWQDNGDYNTALGSQALNWGGGRRQEQQHGSWMASASGVPLVWNWQP